LTEKNAGKTKINASLWSAKRVGGYGDKRELGESKNFTGTFRA